VDRYIHNMTLKNTVYFELSVRCHEVLAKLLCFFFTKFTGNSVHKSLWTISSVAFVFCYYRILQHHYAHAAYIVLVFDYTEWLVAQWPCSTAGTLAYNIDSFETLYDTHAVIYYWAIVKLLALVTEISMYHVYSLLMYIICCCVHRVNCARLCRLMTVSGH